MGHRLAILLLLLAGTGLARAEPLPADCPPNEAATTDLPLWLDLGGRPGVPRGTGGYVYGDVKVAPDGTTCQAASPQLPSDVLHGDGDPSAVLRGAGRHDLLGGSPSGTVRVEAR